MRFWRGCSFLLGVFLCLLAAGSSPAQYRGVEAASLAPPRPVSLKTGSEVAVPLTFYIRAGYHINSNRPAEDYLIPTRLTWEPQQLELKRVEYPEAETVKYEFSEKPLSVYSNKIVIRSTFDVPAQVPAGITEIRGKLRYQACTEKACLAPKTIPVSVPVLSAK